MSLFDRKIIFFVTTTAKLYLVGQTIGYMKMS
jgi:hypothetical protein